MTTALGSLVCIPGNGKKKLLKNAINSNVTFYDKVVLVNQVQIFAVANNLKFKRLSCPVYFESISYNLKKKKKVS